MLEMSQSSSALSIIAFIVGNVISIYFLYQVLKGVFYHFTQRNDDDL